MYHKTPNRKKLTKKGKKHPLINNFYRLYFMLYNFFKSGFKEEKKKIFVNMILKCFHIVKANIGKSEKHTEKLYFGKESFERHSSFSSTFFNLSEFFNIFYSHDYY